MFSLRSCGFFFFIFQYFNKLIEQSAASKKRKFVLALKYFGSTWSTLTMYVNFSIFLENVNFVCVLYIKLNKFCILTESTFLVTYSDKEKDTTTDPVAIANGPSTRLTFETERIKYFNAIITPHSFSPFCFWSMCFVSFFFDFAILIFLSRIPARSFVFFFPLIYIGKSMIAFLSWSNVRDKHLGLMQHLLMLSHVWTFDIRINW